MFSSKDFQRMYIRNMTVIKKKIQVIESDGKQFQAMSSVGIGKMNKYSCTCFGVKSARLQGVL